MLVKEAIVARIVQLCEERNLAYNELATRSGVTPSTVYSMLSHKRKDMSVITLKKLCDGLDMPLPKFFDCEIFENLDQELQ